MPVLQFLAPGGDPTVTAELLGLLSQALSSEGLANYFTRQNNAAAAKLWAELLSLTFAASTAQPPSPQLCLLADRTAVAVLQHCPQDRAGWHRGGALLRLARLAPWGKWRALREALGALERQKAAFAASHGAFLYLVAIGVKAGFRGAGLGSVLLDHICRHANSQQLPLYVEATTDGTRGWLRRHGFRETMKHCVRPHAPPVYILVRWPVSAAGAAVAAATGAAAGAPAVAPAGNGAVQGNGSSGNGRAGWAAAAGGSSVGRSGQQVMAQGEAAAAVAGEAQVAAPAPKPVLRPAGSVRSR